jgi:hypothetical protein
MITSIRLREFLVLYIRSLIIIRTNPFGSITDSWAEKYGYTTTEDFIQNAQKKFSLVETGVVDQPNCRLLLLNVRLP